MRKIVAFLLAMLLLVTSVGSVGAVTEELVVDETLSREAHQLYLDCLLSAGRESFHGFCGMMVSYQIWKLGINKDLQTYDGNQQFDAYKDLEMTTGGYRVEAYSSRLYTLEKALNAITENGTKNVRNLLLGFQWTNTVAGGTYGHACFVNAIENGVVYFTESFDYAMGRMEGETVTCTIEELVAFFVDWTVFDGIIYFGEKQYSDSCVTNDLRMGLQLRFESNLRSQPCLVGENDCQKLRSLAPGEVLYATGVCENEYGDLFYRVKEDGREAFVSANAVFQLQPAPESGENGWFVRDDNWYCYENGKPCTGWTTRIGVDYYLGKDGKVTTGKVQVEGTLRYFSSTGALSLGWIALPEGVCYQTKEAGLLKGLQEIDGSLYYFNENGYLQKDSPATPEEILSAITEAANPEQ